MGARVRYSHRHYVLPANLRNRDTEIGHERGMAKYMLQIVTLAQSALRGNRKPSSIVVELKEINLRLKTKNLFCYIGFCPLAPRDKIRCGLL